MQPDMDSYFMPPPRLANPSQAACNSVNPSNPSDSDPRISSLDSKSSNDTVPEKHNHEDGGKEKEDRDSKNTHKGKEDEASSRNRKMSADKRNIDSRKRTSESALIDNLQGHEGESSDFPCKKRPLTSGSNILDDSIHMPEGSGLTVAQLIEHVQMMRKKGLVSEYAHIRMEPLVGTFNYSRVRHNLPKNRYTDVLCYDHSRVKLPLMDGDPTTDYINANFVDGYMQKNAYISTQGPLPKTFVDFWRMVWHYQCQVIVMTTRTVERQRIKCGQYWPYEEQSDEQFEEFNVHNSSVKSFKNYLETKLVVHNTSTGEQRDITHLQFISWPDYGIPPAASFLDFLFHVRAVQETATKNLGSSWTGHPLGPPIVVHCSAGIGRTGTFITIDISLRRLEDINTVDVPATVRRIRTQRAFSIQMPDQYVFCHLGIVEQAIRNGLVKDMDCFSLENSESDSE